MRRFLLSMFIFTRLLMAQEPDSLSLQTAIDMALKNNPDILSFEQELAAAAGRVQQAKAWPDAEIGLSWGAVPGDFNLHEADETAIGLTQNFEWPGKRRLRRIYAQQDEKELQIRLQQLRRAIGAEIQRRYFRCAWRQKRIYSILRSQQLLQQWQQLVQQRYQARVSNYLDVLRGRIENAKIENERIGCEQTLTADFSQLNQLLGYQTNRRWYLTDSLQFSPVEKDLQQYQVRIKEQTLAVKIAQEQMLQAETRLKIARQSGRPDFRIGLQSQFLKGQPPYSANQYTGVDKNWYWGAELTISLPLGTRRRVRGATMEAHALYDQKSLALQVAERELQMAAVLAFERAQASEQQVRNVRSNLLTEVENQWQTALTLYSTQQLNAFELVEFWRALYETRAALDIALFNHCLALIDLENVGDHLFPQGESNENNE